MKQSSYQRTIRLVFAALGLFGAAVAITGVLFVLPGPVAGGTCGPGRQSEAPIMALVNPVSIGAGQEPAATNAAAHDQWLAFVGECQASTDGRVLAALAILVLSIGIAIGGPMLLLRTRRSVKSSPLTA